MTGQVLCLPWDEEYVPMVESVKGRMMSQDRKNIIAKIDDFSPVMLNGKHFPKTVHVMTCEVLISKGKFMYRNSLRTICHRWSKKKIVSPSHWQSTRSKINVCWLNAPERTERYSQLSTRLDTKLKQVKHLLKIESQALWRKVM